MSEENEVDQEVVETIETVKAKDEKLGIKEISEVFDGLDVIASFAGSVLADGKVNIGDLNSLVSLATKFGALSSAVEGAAKAVDEGKDLDRAEVAIILSRVYGVVEKFAASKKA